MPFYAVLVPFLSALVLTPIVIKLSFLFDATDKPGKRKVHVKVMPRIGGVALYISFLIGAYLTPPPVRFYFIPILLGSFVIFLTGLLDDLYDLRPRGKVLGQLIAAALVIFIGGVQIEFINLPFGGMIHFGAFSVPITFLWIIGITNAMNLIDGLDGLAAGVGIIVLSTMAALALMMNNMFVFVMCLMLIGSSGGFLVFNFYPAKIFMGDSGALLLGYMIAVLSLLGFKNATAISLIVPLLVLGVPISDTFFAIIRRVREKKPISAPDRSHLHHCLLKLGHSHRQSVLLIYGISAIFGTVAFFFSHVGTLGAVLLLIFVFLATQLLAERIGLIHENYRPLLNLIERVQRKTD